MEALILYFVLFFPVIHAPPPEWLAQGIGAAGTVPFSGTALLSRTLTYTLPAMALVLYLISRGGLQRGLEPADIRRAAPGKRDMLPFAIGLPGLIITGLFVAFLVSRFAGATSPPVIEGPHTLIGWAVVVLACLGTGYLEEIYFRYYLLTKLENTIPQAAVRVLFSTALFTISHIHYGPWGLLNAAIAGLFLSALFLRYRSLHGIALAHAGYNMFVYFMGTAG